MVLSSVGERVLDFASNLASTSKFVRLPADFS